MPPVSPSNKHTKPMFSNTNTQGSTATPATITAQAELAAFSSETGCPARVSAEPVDPRYAHSAALGRRQQDTSHKRARRCQECTRPLPTACTSRYCTSCEPCGPSGDLWSFQDTAVKSAHSRTLAHIVAHDSQTAKTDLQQQQLSRQSGKSVSSEQAVVCVWKEDNHDQEDTARVVAAPEGDDDEVPDEWDAEDD